MPNREKEWQDDRYSFIVKRAKNWKGYAKLHKKLDEGKIDFKSINKKQKETILDALVLAGLYQSLLDKDIQRDNVTSFLLNKIEKAGESFKYRAKDFDLEKSMKWACTQMGWIEPGKGKRKMLTAHEEDMLIKLYEFSIRTHIGEDGIEYSKAEKQEEIEKIYDLFGFQTPGACARYLRKLGLKNIPDFQ